MAAWNEIWERVNIGDEKFDYNMSKDVRDKYKVATIPVFELTPIMNRDTPPTAGDLREYMKTHNRLCQMARKKRKEEQQPETQTELNSEPSVEFEEIPSTEEWQLTRLKEAKEWLNRNGYVCEVKLTKQIII